MNINFTSMLILAIVMKLCLSDDIITCQSYCFQNSQFFECPSESCLGPCNSCQNNCIYVSSQNGCITCGEKYFLVEGSTYSCITDCPSGYYLNEKYCRECSTGCSECSSSSECSSCLDDYFLVGTSCVKCNENQVFFEGECLSNCPTSYFKTGDSCSKCIDNCGNCENGEKCLICNEGYFVDLNNGCSKCESPCQSCLNSTYCSGCESDYVLYDFGIGERNCIHAESCGTGFAIIDDYCAKCEMEFCENCDDDPTKCFQCKQDYYTQTIQNSYVKCFQNCPESTYTDSSVMKCQNCIDNCQICSTQTACETCNENYVLFESTCLTSCPSYFYWNNGICEECQIEGCKECGHKNNCIECEDDLLLIMESSIFECIEDCEDGYIYNPQSLNCVEKQIILQDDSNSYLLIGIIIGCSMFCLLILFCCLCFICSKKRKKAQQDQKTRSHIYQEAPIQDSPKKNHNYQTKRHKPKPQQIPPILIQKTKTPPTETLTKISSLPSKEPLPTTTQLLDELLPSTKYTSEGSQTFCNFCFETFEEDDLVKKPKNCNHLFHFNCFEQYLQSIVSKISLLKAQCPQCLEPIFEISLEVKQ